jgi:hypothetical protein
MGSNKKMGCVVLSADTLPYQHEPKHPKHITKKHYKNVMNLFFKKIVYHMIKEGRPFLMPHRLGKLQLLRYNYEELIQARIASGRTNPYSIDYAATKKLKERGINKEVKFTCKSTGGFWVKLHWFKIKHARFPNQKFYSFKFARPNMRPNTYNKNNPELSVIPYFRDKGWEIYSEFNFKTRTHDQE